MMVPFSRITFGEKVSDLVLFEACCFPADPGLFEEVFPQQPPSQPPLGEQTDDRPGSVPCSTGPSNIYSAHKLLPTGSLTAFGHCSELGEEAEAGGGVIEGEGGGHVRLTVMTVI